MKEPQLNETVATAMSFLPRPRTESVLGEDRCDVRRPGHSLVYCSLHVGHGSNHQCSTREGEGHEWA
jgi:hypothetical protein